MPTRQLPQWEKSQYAIRGRTRGIYPGQTSEHVSVALPAEPRGEKKLFFVQILGGEKLLKFGEKWAVKNF